VFELENGSVTLTEIAPGARLEQDILAQIGFKPRISPQLRDMDPRIFRSGPMGIAQSFKALPARSRKVA